MKETIFVVEDNPVQQRMMRVHFEEMLGDYTVKAFVNPEELFDHLKEKPFAVVLDHYFGDQSSKTGLDYLKQIKKSYPSIPVIYYTTLHDAEVKAQILKVGVADFIPKDSASLVRLRTAIDTIKEKKSKGFWRRLIGA